jgi:hypothetical protein
LFNASLCGAPSLRERTSRIEVFESGLALRDTTAEVRRHCQVGLSLFGGVFANFAVVLYVLCGYSFSFLSKALKTLAAKIAKKSRKGRKVFAEKGLENGFHTQHEMA